MLLCAYRSSAALVLPCHDPILFTKKSPSHLIDQSVFFQITSHLAALAQVWAMQGEAPKLTAQAALLDATGGDLNKVMLDEYAEREAFGDTWRATVPASCTLHPAPCTLNRTTSPRHGYSRRKSSTERC